MTSENVNSVSNESNKNEKLEQAREQLRKLAADALQVQNACNILGVTKSMASSVQELADALRVIDDNVGTDDIARHPITQLWAEKVGHLAGLSLFATADRMQSWAVCRELAGLDS